MKIKIEGSPKEIAAFLMCVGKQPCQVDAVVKEISDSMNQCLISTSDSTACK